jgi:hypothetical protein
MARYLNCTLFCISPRLLLLFVLDVYYIIISYRSFSVTRHRKVLRSRCGICTTFVGSIENHDYPINKCDTSKGMTETRTMVTILVISACYLLHVSFLFGLFFNLKRGNYIFLRNVGSLSTDYTSLYYRRDHSEIE